MRRSLVALLACPECKAELGLRVEREEADDVEEGTLACTGCAMQFPIVRGIPRFVPRALAADKRATAAAFGWQWTHPRHDKVLPEHEQQFLAWVAPLGREDCVDRVILDAGAGKGRHLECAARFGATHAIGVDLSDAVESAWRNVKNFPNAHVVQADIYKLPFREGTFDLAFSIGVLHHLPDPRRGFDALVLLVRAGGRVAAWVYGRESNGWLVHVVTPVREAVTSRLPKPALEALAGVLAACLLWPLIHFVYGPLNRIAPSFARRYLFYNDYLASLERLPLSEVVTIVFDHLVAPTTFYVRRDEFEAWFQRPDLKDVVIGWHNRNSWRGLATRTAGRG